MFVLRECRRIGSELLSTPMENVRPDTPLGEQASAALERLFSLTVEELIAEQVLDESVESVGSALAAGELRGDDVAAVAEQVTRAAVRLLVANRLDVPVTELSTELSFALDLGADSLTRVDLVLLLEETLEVSVPDDSMFLVQTVGDAELFAVLFDRTREEVVLALGEEARDLTFDTSLRRFGAEAPAAALEAAGRAVGADVRLPVCECDTLKDVVRLAFLAEKLRVALAEAAGVTGEKITGATRPGPDLGLDGPAVARVLEALTASMDLAAPPVESSDELTLTELVGVVAARTGPTEARR